MKKPDIRSLVDRLAIIRQEEKRLKTETEEIKDRLAALEQKTIEGENYILTIKDAERNSLDLDRIKSEMGSVWYEDHLLTTYFLKFDLESKNKAT